MEVSREKKREKRNDRPPPKDLLSPHEKTKVWGSPSRSARRRAALTAIAVAVLGSGDGDGRESRYSRTASIENASMRNAVRSRATARRAFEGCN